MNQSLQLTASNLKRWRMHVAAVSQLDRIEATPAVATAPVPAPANYLMPHNTDRLFWLFYIACYGADKYEGSTHAAFTIENDTKISMIDVFRSNKAQLKAAKLRPYAEIESNLMEPQIDLRTFVALCTVNHLHVAVVMPQGRKWFELCAADNESDAILVDLDRGVYIGADVAERVRDIRATAHQIQSFADTKLKGIGAYKKPDLIALCRKFNVEIGEKATKPELYELLLPHF